MLAKKFRLPIQTFFGPEDKKNTGFIQKRNRYFLLRVKENGLGFGRFGIIVSSKVSKSAVKRNQIKRIFFDLIRTERIHEKKQKDFLITVLSPASQLGKLEIKKEIFSLMGEANKND